MNIRSTVPIFAVLAVLGVNRAFQMPATQSFVPTLVPTAALRNALAINSSTGQVAVIAGPSIGGIVYALAEKQLGANSGAGVVYAAAAILLLAAIILVALIQKR